MINEMPHAQYDNSDIPLIDFRIEKMPISKEQKKALMKSFNSGKGIFAYSKVKKQWIKFTNKSMEYLYKEPKESDLKLPDDWTKYAVVMDKNTSSDKALLKDFIREMIITEFKRKWVIRKGKRVRKLICPPGKKAKDGKCVTMKSSERIKRRIALKKTVRKRKAKKAQLLRKRRISNRKRKSMGL